MISWADSGAERYDLYINEVGVGSAVYRRQTLTGSSHTLETELAPAKACRVWIRSYFSDGSRSRWGTAADLFVVDGEVLNTTPQLSKEANVLSWTPVQNAVEYHIWINESSSNGFTHDVQNDRTATITSLPLDHDAGEYRAWVAAVYADGTRSDWSNAVTVFISDASAESFRDEELIAELLNQQFLTSTTNPTPSKHSLRRHAAPGTVLQNNQPAEFITRPEETADAAEKDTIMIAFAERTNEPSERARAATAVA